MRILYFTRDYTTHDHRFLSAFARSEHQIYYLRLERRGYALEDRPVPAEINLIPWVGGNKSVKFTDSLRLFSDLRRVIRIVKPDIIQAGPLQTTAFLVALSGFSPLVSMSWGYDLLVDAHRNRWWGWATRFTLRKSAAMVGDSDIIRQKAIQYGMEPDRIVTFPWGVNLRRFSPGYDNGLRARLGWEKDTFVLISTRGWAPIYGVEELARAFVLAAQKRPDLHLLMLGGGPQASLIQRIFIENDMLDRVHFPGYVKQVDLPRYYRAADLYVSTSHSDGTSISMLEALACGRPVLLSDIPGNREWIEPGVHGWLFSDGDVDALTQAIIQAVDWRNRLPGIAQAARELAEERANWNQNFPQLFKAYEIALNGN